MHFPPQIRWKLNRELIQTARSQQPLSPIFSPLTQLSSVRFKPADKECIFIGSALVCSRAQLFPALGGIPSTDMWSSCDLNHKGTGAGDSRRFNLHPHLSNENTKLRLVEPALHHSVCVWLRLHVDLFCVRIPASAGACLHMCASACVKPKWHSGQLRSRRRRSAGELPMDAAGMLMMHWRQRRSVSLSDRWTHLRRGSVRLSDAPSLWLCHHLRRAWITNDSGFSPVWGKGLCFKLNFWFHLSSSLYLTFSICLYGLVQPICSHLGIHWLVN